MKIFKSSVVLIFAVLGFANFALADVVTYKFNAVDPGDPTVYPQVPVAYKVTVTYDDAAPNITNNPWGGWTTSLTVPDAVMTVEAKGQTFVSGFGVKLSYSVNSYDSFLRVEALSNPNGSVDTAQFDVFAQDAIGILDPLGTGFGDLTLESGNHYFYLNSIGFYTYPYMAFDLATANFSKVQGDGSVDTCAIVQEVVIDLQAICATGGSCLPHNEQPINDAIGKLQTACF